MGDRANVYVHPAEQPGVYLYTHWAGTELPETVRRALASAEGRGRWDDDSYLARIIFGRMIAGDPEEGDPATWRGRALAELLGERGFGISAYAPDGRDRIVDVDTVTSKVTIRGKSYSFEEYAGLSKAPDWSDG